MVDPPALRFALAEAATAYSRLPLNVLDEHYRPEDRQLIKLGTLTITGMAADQEGMDKSLLFLPGNVPDGIEPADPMIEVRSNAYPISFGERQ